MLIENGIYAFLSCKCFVSHLSPDCDRDYFCLLPSNYQLHLKNSSKKK